MTLLRFKDAYPDRHATFGNGSNVADLDDYSVYSSGEDKIGSVKDALFEDTTSAIRYLIVDTGFWIFGKNVLVPVGLARFDYDKKRIYVNGLTKEQVEDLPEYHSDTTVDRDYENRIRSSYQTLGQSRQSQFTGKKYDANRQQAYPGSAALHGVNERPVGATSGVATTNRRDADRYDYDAEPGLYGMDDDSHQAIRLYQERLVADKDRFRTGSVSVGKRVETETQEATVPIANERVVIERTNPTNAKASTRTPDFKEGEVARIETYGEKANIHKESFVREEVNVRKEVDRDTVTGKETLRREELDVNTNGDPDVTRR